MALIGGFARIGNYSDLYKLIMLGRKYFINLIRYYFINKLIILESDILLI